MPTTATPARPQPSVMQSTPVPCTITRTDGTVDTGTVRVVHPARTAPPAEVTHVCTATCGRPS